MSKPPSCTGRALSPPFPPPQTGKGSQTSLHGIKAPFLFGSECPRSGAGMAPGSSSSGGGGVPKATRCGRGSRPERAGGGGKGAGMGRSSLGHGVLVEVRRYESIKNHFLPNSCRERGEEWSERPSLIPQGLQGIPEPPTCLSGAGPCLCPCPDAARAPGSAPGNNPRADRHCGADPGAAGCSRGTGWESAPGIGVFSFGKRGDKTQRVTS